MAPDSESRANRTPGALRARLDFDDARLLAECDVQLHRTGGPGGQHRNKVSSAVRLVHQPTGFVVTATERRSQHENRANAVRRLREAIAIGVRLPLTPQPAWPESIQAVDGRLRVGEHNPGLWAALALALDALASYTGQIGDAATRLGVSTSSLTRFLHEHPKAWVAANELRKQAGLGPLRA